MINLLDIENQTSHHTFQKVFSFYFGLGLYALLYLNACKQSNLCLEPQSIVLRGGFYHKDTANKNQDTLLMNANLIFGNTTKYFINYKKQNKFSLPLSPLQDTMQVIFQSDSTTSTESTIDTFHLIYQRKLNFISVACGYQTYYTLQSTLTTHHVIDSVLIGIPEITNDVNKEHLKIIVKN
jgi:Family of unknown function (DUF6452)